MIEITDILGAIIELGQSAYSFATNDNQMTLVGLGVFAVAYLRVKMSRVPDDAGRWFVKYVNNHKGTRRARLIHRVGSWINSNQNLGVIGLYLTFALVIALVIPNIILFKLLNGNVPQTTTGQNALLVVLIYGISVKVLYHKRWLSTAGQNVSQAPVESAKKKPRHYYSEGEDTASS